MNNENTISQIASHVLKDLKRLDITDVNVKDVYVNKGYLDQYKETIVEFKSQEDLNYYKLVGSWTDVDYIRLQYEE